MSTHSVQPSVWDVKREAKKVLVDCEEIRDSYRKNKQWEKADQMIPLLIKSKALSDNIDGYARQMLKKNKTIFFSES